MALKASPEAAAVLSDVALKAFANIEHAIKTEADRADRAEMERNALRAKMDESAAAGVDPDESQIEQTEDGEADPSAAGPILAAYATDGINVGRAKELLMLWQRGASRQAILDLMPKKEVV